MTLALLVICMLKMRAQIILRPTNTGNDVWTDPVNDSTECAIKHQINTTKNTCGAKWSVCYLSNQQHRLMPLHKFEQIYALHVIVTQQLACFVLVFRLYLNRKTVVTEKHSMSLPQIRSCVENVMPSEWTPKGQFCSCHSCHADFTAFTFYWLPEPFLLASNSTNSS